MSIRKSKRRKLTQNPLGISNRIFDMATTRLQYHLPKDAKFKIMPDGTRYRTDEVKGEVKEE